MAVKDQVAELSRRINPKQKNLRTIDGPQCVDPMLCSRRQRGADWSSPLKVVHQLG